MACDLHDEKIPCQFGAKILPRLVQISACLDGTFVSFSYRPLTRRFFMSTYDPTPNNSSPDLQGAFDPPREQAAEFSAPTHPALMGYMFWIIGFTGAHRFYYGKPLTGALWFFTGGLFLIGWIVDLFLIPGMAEEAEYRYPAREIDYSLAWVLLIFLGIFGVHRFYRGKFVSGLVYLLTGGLFGIGYVYDICTLNDQIKFS